ncbi:hypothetical protein DFJ73DRAFT_967295, partial [Zopfochytrium polystomum]
MRWDMYCKLCGVSMSSTCLDHHRVARGRCVCLALLLSCCVCLAVTRGNCRGIPENAACPSPDDGQNEAATSSAAASCKSCRPCRASRRRLVHARQRDRRRGRGSLRQRLARHRASTTCGEPSLPEKTRSLPRSLRQMDRRRVQAQIPASVDARRARAILCLLGWRPQSLPGRRQHPRDPGSRASHEGPPRVCARPPRHAIVGGKLEHLRRGNRQSSRRRGCLCDRGTRSMHRLYRGSYEGADRLIPVPNMRSTTVDTPPTESIGLFSECTALLRCGAHHSLSS